MSFEYLCSERLFLSDNFDSGEHLRMFVSLRILDQVVYSHLGKGQYSHEVLHGFSSALFEILIGNDRFDVIFERYRHSWVGQLAF